MNDRWVRILIAAAMTIALPFALSAQQSDQPSNQAQKRPVRPKSQPQMDPILDEEDQISPSQVLREPPAPKPSRPAAATRAAAPPAEAKVAPAANPSPAPAKGAAAGHAIACNGAFAKDSSHVKLAMVFGPQNVTYSEVSGGGTKIMASVLFPKDPKRRLEVLWANEPSRSGTSLIDINGQSTWTAHKGLRLGLSIAAVEKLNGRPFKVQGFDKDGEAPASDWMGGTLLEAPGGCKVGVHFRPDPKASAEARAAASAVDKEFGSNDPAIVALKPTVSEILIGF